MNDDSLVYYLFCEWEHFKRCSFSSQKNEMCIAQFQVRSQVGGDDVCVGHLSCFPGTPPVVPGVGRAALAGVVSALSGVPVGFPLELTPHSLLSGSGQGLLFVIKKNASSGKSRCVAWKTTLSLEQGV